MNRPRSDVKILSLSGELDIAGKEALREMLSSAWSASGILLDLSRVTYADSTALTELLRFSLRCQERKIPMAMLIATPQLERILRYAGLYDTFAVFGDHAEALRYLEAPR